MENPAVIPPTVVEDLGILFERNPLAMWLFDRETLRILAVNDAAVAEYGYSREEFLSLTVEQIPSPEELLRLRAALAGPADGRLQQGERRHLRRDGTLLDVEVATQDLALRGRPVRLVMAMNVTARRRAADRLALLHSVTSALGEAITPDEVARVVVDRGVAALGAQSGAFAILDRSGSALEVVRAVGYPAEIVERFRHLPLDAAFPLADAAREALPIFLDREADRAARYPHLAEIRRSNGAGPMAAVPVLIAGRAIGALGLNFPHGAALGEEERAAILNLAQQSAQALHRTRLFQEERRSREAAERLQALTAALSQAVTEDGVADVVVHHGISALGAAAGMLVRPAGGGRLDVVRSAGYAPALLEAFGSLPAEGETPLAEAFRTGEPVLIPSAAAAAQRYPGLAEVWRMVGEEARAAVPLTLRGRRLGVLGFAFPGERDFPEGERAFLLVLAQQAAQALERASLYAALERSRDDARLLADASRTLTSSLDYQETLATVARLAVPAFADWCAVDLLAADSTIERVAVMHASPDLLAWAREVQDSVAPRLDDPAGIGAVIRTGEPSFAPEITGELIAATAPTPLHAEVWRRMRLSSAITVPMVVRGRILGALTFLQAESGRHYTPEDLELASELGQRAAVAVENARLYTGAHEARAEAERASHAKSQFLAVMSHELRTPLNAVLGYADLLDAEVAGPLNEKQHAQLDRLQGSARHLCDLIDQVLGFARIEAGREEVRLATADLADLAREAAGLLQPLAAQRGLHVAVEVPDHPVPVETDPGRVRQILLNLLGNAIKYSEQGRVELRVLRDGGSLLCRVRDSGVGIDACDLERIFEPFTQVDQSTTRRVGGTGLGLPISRRLARLLGGDIVVESARGVGSTFTLRLPG
jgi:PAS domain S-box-containing protein